MNKYRMFKERRKKKKEFPQNNFNCSCFISNPLITPNLSAAKFQDESLKGILNIIKHNYDIILGR